MKKKIALLLSLVMAFAVFGAGCSPQGGGGVDTDVGETIEVNPNNFNGEINIWWAPGDKYVTPLTNGLERIKAEHPEFKYKINQQASTDYYDKLSTTLMSPNPKNAPDIVRVAHTGVQTLAAYGKFVNMSAYKGNNEFSKNFDENLWNANKLGNSSFAMPLDANTMTLMYNTEIFKAAGIVDSKGNALPPTNKAEFEAACDKILAYNKATGKAILPYDVSLKKVAGSIDVPVFSLTTQLGKMGGTMLTEDNKTSNVDSPIMKETLNLMKEWKTKGYIDGSWREGEFYIGQVAMFEMGSWSKNIIEGENSAVRGQIKVAPTFSLKEGIAGKSTLGLYSLAICNSSKVKDVAYNVIKALSSDEKFILEFCKAVDLLPSKTSVYQDPFFSSEFYTVYRQQLKNAIARPGSPAWKDIEQITANMMESIFISNSPIDDETAEAKVKIQKKISYFDNLLNK